jgi:hypothetical protein
LRLFTPGHTESDDLEGTPRTVFDMLVAVMTTDFDRAREEGLLRDGMRADDAVEFLTRTLISMLAMPGHVNRTEAELRQFIRTYAAAAFFRDEALSAPNS